jgi:hypothetical protein
MLGLVYIGSAVVSLPSTSSRIREHTNLLQAFNAFVGSFIILSSASYLAAILPHLLSKRKNIELGPFKLPDKLAAMLMPFACAYMMAFIVIFCFPTS